MRTLSGRPFVIVIAVIRNEFPVIVKTSSDQRLKMTTLNEAVSSATADISTRSLAGAFGVSLTRQCFVLVCLQLVTHSTSQSAV